MYDISYDAINKKHISDIACINGLTVLRYHLQIPNRVNIKHDCSTFHELQSLQVLVAEN